MSTEATVPATVEATSRARSMSPIIIAVAVMAVLMVALVYIAVTATNTEHATKRAAFENVLNMSSAELESKTVTELNGYRQDIKTAANYSLAFGNITGYDEAVVDHELDQINDLILKKTDH